MNSFFTCVQCDNVNVLFHSTKCLPSDDVQDEEESETVRLGEFRELNAAMIGYCQDCDLTEELQIGRQFNLFDEVKELLDKFKACGHPMRVFNSQSVDYTLMIFLVSSILRLIHCKVPLLIAWSVSIVSSGLSLPLITPWILQFVAIVTGGYSNYHQSVSVISVGHQSVSVVTCGLLLTPIGVNSQWLFSCHWQSMSIASAKV